jgi:solute carrier family 10 (sodium/bile acid cotransporter), member 7
VYSAFCDSIQADIWRRHGWALSALVFAFVALLFIGMSLLIYTVCELSRLDRQDWIAAYFCSVKKTLAIGVPLAMLIFGNRSDLSLLLLPIMMYHPLQLFVNGILAQQWGKQRDHAPANGKQSRAC